MRVLVLVCSCAMVGGCGLTDTGAAAASGGGAAAQQAAQAPQKEQRLKQQIESVNQEAVERERAAADAAGK